MLMRHTAIVAVVFLTVSGFAAGDREQPSVEASQQQVQEMTRIRMRMQDTEITAVLDDNPAAGDFASLLPVTLTLEDYNSIEKVSDLPSRLSTDGAPEGFDPSPGDITYYAPWGNLALFYRDFGYARGLVQLGRIESGLEFLEQPGFITVTIERIE